MPNLSKFRAALQEDGLTSDEEQPNEDNKLHISIDIPMESDGETDGKRNLSYKQLQDSKSKKQSEIFEISEFSEMFKFVKHYKQSSCRAGRSTKKLQFGSAGTRKSQAKDDISI